MGVPFIFSYFNKKYKGICNDNEEICVDEIYFDYNSLIHPCSKYSEIKTDEAIINECINWTKYVLSCISYKKCFIVIDGVAPKSKMIQQRERRFKKINSGEWDSNKITPGTEFMDKLKIKLEKEFGKEYISGADIPGEGEHKIMKMINDPTKKYCIYGLDADLIFLSMLNKCSNSIILLRDYDNTMKNPFILDIQLLKTRIYKDISSRNFIFKKLSISEEQLIKDYCLLCLFFGNDFLKAIPGISIKENGVEYIINMYITFLLKKNRGIISDRNLDLDDLKFLFGYAIKKENSVFKDNFDCKMDNETCNIYTNENAKLKDKQSYYMYYGINKNNIEDACINYIRGIYWVLGYYFNHSHENWSWYYEYYNTPFPSDLFNFCKKKSIDTSFDKDFPVSVEKQMFLVLPKHSLNSEIYQNIFDYLDEYYPDYSNLFLDTVNKHYSWEGIVFFKRKLTEEILNLFLI